MSDPAIAAADGGPRLFILTAWHGGYLCLNAGTGELASAPPGSPFLRYPPVLAHIPRDGAALAALVPLTAPDATIAIAPHAYCNAVLPLRLVWRGAGHVALLHPLSLRYVLARPLGREEVLGAVAAEAERAGEQETFELFEAPRSLVMQPVLARLDAVAALLSGPREADALIRHLETADGASAQHVLDAALPLLPLDRLARLAEAILRDPRLAARLAALLPDDMWAARGLPALSEWLALRPSGPARKLALGADSDILAEAGRGHFVSFAHACNALARRRVAPRRDFCAIAAARDHGLYLLEWIAYHRVVGVQDFFLYANGNEDHSRPLLAALADAGVIAWIDNAGGEGRARDKAYAHALTMLPDVLDYRWAAAIGPDEFVVFDPVRFGSALDFLAWHEMRAVDAIMLERIEIGSGGARAWRDEPVIRRFRRRIAGRPGSAGAAIFRPQKFIHAAPELPSADERHAPIRRRADGEEAAFATEPKSRRSAEDYACVYHYEFKSAEEYLCRLARPRADRPGAMGLRDAEGKVLLRRFMEQHESAGISLDGRIERCAPRLDAEIAALRALTGVAEAEARVRRAYRARAARVAEEYRAVSSAVDLA